MTQLEQYGLLVLDWLALVDSQLNRAGAIWRGSFCAPRQEVRGHGLSSRARGPNKNQAKTWLLIADSHGQRTHNCCWKTVSQAGTQRRLLISPGNVHTPEQLRTANHQSRWKVAAVCQEHHNNEVSTAVK